LRSPASDALAIVTPMPVRPLAHRPAVASPATPAWTYGLAGLAMMAGLGHAARSASPAELANQGLLGLAAVALGLALWTLPSPSTAYHAKHRRLIALSLGLIAILLVLLAGRGLAPLTPTLPAGLHLPQLQSLLLAGSLLATLTSFPGRSSVRSLLSMALALV
jgi:hypothetical protein